MGSVVKSVGNLITGKTPTVKTAQISKQPFDLSKEADPAKQIAEQQRLQAQQRQQAAQTAQQALITQLQGQAAGTGPSLAEAQLRSAGDRSLAQQLAAASAMRGGAVGARQKALLSAQQDTARDINQQAAETRMQEAGQARQQLGALLAQEQAASDQLVANYLQKGYDFATATKMAQQQLALNQAQLTQRSREANAQAETGIMGGLLSAAGGIGGSLVEKYSDKRLKENIAPAKKDLKDFLDKLQSAQYDYKNPNMPGAGHGRQYGIMAQDLEKSKVGKTLVKNTPEGKMVDTATGFGAVLAATAELNKRLAALEKKRKV